MEKKDKIAYFECVIDCLLQWHTEKTGQVTNDFSFLKLHNFLFFITAAETVCGTGGVLLENVFDNFFATPFGHREQDIYDALKESDGHTGRYIIDNRSTETVEGNFEKGNANPVFINAIESSILYLKKYSPTLIRRNQFDLVDLSHSFYSWQHALALVHSEGKKIAPIPPELIRSEYKVFDLGPWWWVC